MNCLKPDTSTSSASTPSSQRPITVFYLDNFPELLELAKIALEECDSAIRVETFTSPEEMLKCMGRESCDCIISSYKMRNLTIKELAPKVREIKDVPIILYTSYHKEEVEEAIESAGIARHIMKGRELSHYGELTRAIREEVERHKAETMPGPRRPGRNTYSTISR